MSSKSFALFIFLALASLGQAAYGEDYAQCKSRCNQELTACMSSDPDTADAGRLAEERVQCQTQLEACYAECSALQPRSEIVKEVLVASLDQRLDLPR